MTDRPDLENWTCPLPLRDQTSIVMGHGGGGRLSGELVRHLFLPAFGGTQLSGVLEQLGDAAVLENGGGRLAFTTDSYVVRPRFFPGGNVGDLAINGTVNDLAVSGAEPLALSVGLILEEGMPLDELGVITETMGRAARAAGVSIVTGDTKVVDAGHGDGVYINTAGIGRVRPGLELGPSQVCPGDRILVSGPVAAHGIAVMSVRDGLEFGSDIVTDSQPLNALRKDARNPNDEVTDSEYGKNRGRNRRPQRMDLDDVFDEGKFVLDHLAGLARGKRRQRTGHYQYRFYVPKSAECAQTLYGNNFEECVER